MISLGTDLIHLVCACLPKQLPVTCLGSGNGKLGSASSVQFAMGLFGKTQEKPPEELVSEWSLKIRNESC